MKLYSVSLALAACLSMVTAQGLDGLPDCAKTCATGAIPANCGLDVKCICSDSSFLSGISCCIAGSCPQDQQQEEAHPFFSPAAVQFANQICKGAGVTNLPQSASCASATQSATGTSSGSSATTSGSSATTSGSSSNTATNESNTTGHSSTASQTAATATTSTTGSSSSGSATSSASSTANTNAGAAIAQHKDIGLIAAAGAAAAAFGLLA
ncbi:CFEM domain-containing protein [Aspergillus thermomutatus]|uniref:CFEM domain-containing protein n=1 Tax=Aspergillus thermomutatus TaxID=41047 RepID=A0A397HI83_ASPTH|nr:uncharacterized protein CDV56_105357 [Aspergillus thermomutatus]RHZ62657.1 hypothetical protein CDV56_105357 [Aspergillus thermomutatus]